VQDKQKVATFFEAKAPYWDEIYQRKDVFSFIHQQRLAIVLEWVEQLGLPVSSQILEVGCGAGLASVALAKRGYFVRAMDVASGMVERARQRASAAGVSDRVITILGDVHNLAFPDNCFPAVLAIGVIPWVPGPAQALQELARVIAPGGYLLATTDNRWRLHYLLNPARTPLLDPIRRAMKTIRRGLRRPAGQTLNHLHSLRETDNLFRSAGLKKVRGMTLGFGPFSFFGRQLFADSTGIELHKRLQDLADRGFPVIRSGGGQYLLLTRKPNSHVPDNAAPVFEADDCAHSGTSQKSRY
jgi:ubiquinone/menaquinone biosynthesis C-methylase UbiE